MPLRGERRRASTSWTRMPKSCLPRAEATSAASAPLMRPSQCGAGPLGGARVASLQRPASRQLDGSCASSQAPQLISSLQDDPEPIAPRRRSRRIHKPLRLHVGNELREREALVNVVDQHCATRSENLPRLIKLKARVRTRVKAVMNEEIDLAEAGSVRELLRDDPGRVSTAEVVLRTAIPIWL